MEMERWRDRGEREERDQTADEVFFLVFTVTKQELQSPTYL